MHQWLDPTCFPDGVSIGIVLCQVPATGKTFGLHLQERTIVAKGTVLSSSLYLFGLRRK